MANDQKFLAQITIKLGGTENKELLNDLAEVTVDLTFNLPDMFTIRLHDQEFKWIDNTSLIKLGQAVEISASAPGKTPGTTDIKTLITGEITALEPEFEENGRVTLVIRGYAKGHRLHRGKKTRTFLKMTDSAIVSKIAQEAGLSVKVTSTSVQHEYVIQSNQTDMEFLRFLASRNYYNVYNDGGTVYFNKADESRGSAPDLKWGENLIFFKPTVAATHQVNEVIVKGWDLKTKKEVVGRASPVTGIGPQIGGNYSPSSASSAFGSSVKSEVVNQLITKSDEATALAKSLMKDIQNEMVQAEGKCFGEATLKPGYTVKVQNVGTRFSGDYVLTTVTHTYTPEQGYETHFSISGRQPDTVTHLLGLDNGHQGSGSGNSGDQPLLAIGIVTNNNDPENLGRVKVKFPWLSDVDESHWARVASPGAGKDRGMMWLPEVNDEVLVAFAHGNINQPYILGGLWNGKDAPPLTASEAVAGGAVVKRVIQSRVGHKIIIQDKEGSELIHIIDKTGKNEILIDSVKNDITIKADMNINLEAKTGNMTLKCAQTLKMECTNLNIEAKGPGTIKSNAALSVEGSLMTIKSTGPLKVNGTPISLN